MAKTYSINDVVHVLTNIEKTLASIKGSKGKTSGKGKGGSEKTFTGGKDSISSIVSSVSKLDADSGKNVSLLAVGIHKLNKAVSGVNKHEKAYKVFSNHFGRLIRSVAELSDKKNREGVHDFLKLTMMFSKAAGFVLLTSITLGASLVLMPLAFLSVLIFNATIGLLTRSVRLLGLMFGRRNSIGNRGLKALRSIVISLTLFAIGIGVVALIMSQGATWKGLTLTVLAMVIVVGAFFLISKMRMPIAKGGLGMLFMTLSLMIFTYAIIDIAEKLGSVGLLDMAKAGLVVGAFLLVVSIYKGTSAAFTDIVKGAVAMALMGGTLWVFGKSLKVALDAAGSHPWEDYGKFGVAIVGMTAVMVGLSFAAPYMALGILAMAGMGGALWAFGKGLETSLPIFGKVDKSMIDTIAYAITGIGTAFELKGVKKSSVFWGVKVIRGAGDSLVDISKGLVAFSDFYISRGDKLDFSISKEVLNWDKGEGGIVKARTIGEQLYMVVTGVSKAFAAVGEGKGTWFSPSPVSRGISRVRGIGKSLTDITEGLTAFSDFYLKYSAKGALDFSISSDVLGWDKEGASVKAVTLGEQVYMVITGISKAFAAVGEGKANWFNPSPVAAGIDRVKGAGSNLKSMVDALINMKKLFGDNKDALDFSISKEVLNWTKEPVKKTSFTMGEQVFFVVTGIAQAYSNVGEGKGNWFNPSTVKKGQTRLNGVGASLSNMVNAIVNLDKLMTQKKGAVSFNFNDENSIGYTLKGMVVGLGEVFSIAAGVNNGAKNSVLIDDALFNKVITRTNQMSGVITNLVKAFSPLNDESKVSEASLAKFKKLVEYATLTIRPVDVFSKMADGVTRLTKALKEDSSLDAWQEFFKDLDKASDSTTKIASSVEKSTAAIKEKQIADATQSKDATTQMQAQIAQALNSISSIMSTLPTKISDAIGEAVKKAIEETKQ